VQDHRECYYIDIASIRYEDKIIKYEGKIIGGGGAYVKRRIGYLV